ncbi:MAG: methyltransferase domain-containing protein [Bacilli bacterium]|nr:methyltransferase domain-containing protein [Bacilli bacterium]MBN2696476.1 methyltransferase domain-containing protein [Bacilli bacterium]
MNKIDESEIIHDLLGRSGPKIIQKDGVLRFSLDSVLLADFVRVNPKAKSIIDLGTGVGPIPLLLALKTKAKITGIDIQPELVELARKSVALNHLEDQITIETDDIRVVHSHYEPSSFDIVTCNPPFFLSGNVKTSSPNEKIRVAKEETLIDWATLVIQAKRLLKTGGLFVFIHRASRLEDLIVSLNRERFALKRMRFVFTKPTEPAMMVLIEAANRGRKGSLKLEENLYIHEKNGNYTDEAIKIFRQEESQ